MVVWTVQASPVSQLDLEVPVACEWLISVDFPVVAPQATIYQVIVDNEVSGFRWQGEVDALGTVTELQGP